VPAVDSEQLGVQANQLLASPLAIIDLETTGGHANLDRITEIAVIEVDAGVITNVWQTLVNPHTGIPPTIQSLTGITNAMVADAPSFATLAPDLFERLANRIVIAHNVRFDYSFLKAAFAQAGLTYQARTLCTVRLSRALYPASPRHNLDTLIARHQLQCPARHRALGDAQVLWQFLQCAVNEQGHRAVDAAVRAQLKQPSLPPALDRAQIDAIPDAPGVYFFYGDNDAPLYIGKSIHLRSRVLAHFSAGLRSSREMQIARAVRRVEWIRTAGELGALLKEAQLVKTHLPIFNRQLRRTGSLTSIVLNPLEDSTSTRVAPRSHRTVQLHIEDLAQPLDHSGATRYGLFRSKRAALNTLRTLADTHQLCLQTLGLEPSNTSGACFRHQIQRCAGVCAGKESAIAHDTRLRLALSAMQFVRWPWPGPIGIREQDQITEHEEMHVIDQWCYLGTATDDTELQTLLQRRHTSMRFDPDQYKLLVRYLTPARRAQVIALHAHAQQAQAA
jgi:DNA polymerase-3 subunit epsilon